MKRTPMSVCLSDFPGKFHTLLEGAPLFDSSCSPDARVWLIDREGGFFLKASAPGALEKEAAMTRFFHSKGLGPEVLEYISGEQDWLLTRKVPGEDCLDRRYLSEPEKLCDTTAQLLRQLHETDPSGCCIDRTGEYISQALENSRLGRCDHSLFPDNWGYSCMEDARKRLEAAAPCLKRDTLIHGDYCLPNIMLSDWKLSGFIDLGSGGLGDRHIDLFWGIWSLEFNLKTPRFRQRFLDAYGTDRIEPELLDAVGAFEVFL